MTSIEFLKSEYIKRGDCLPSGVFEDAKEMHEKEMCEFAEFVATYIDKNKNVYGDMLHAKSKYDGAERTIDLLEIFKRDK